MTTNPDDDPLKRFNIDKDANLIDDLVKLLLFGRDTSNEATAKAIASRKPVDCAKILPNDVAHMFEFLAANLDYDNNTYRKWEQVKVDDEFGEANEEVQESLKDWTFDIEKTEENQED